MSVRPARPEDAERVALVQLETWRTAYAELLPAEALAVPPEQAAAIWLHAIEAPESPRHRVLVAMEGVELVGFLASTPAPDEDLDPATVSEVAALLVLPRWGRRGHGSRLVSAAVAGWASDGTTSAVLWAWEHDPVTGRFLDAGGWEPDGRARILDTGPRLERQVRLHTSLGEELA